MNKPTSLKRRISASSMSYSLGVVAFLLFVATSCQSPQSSRQRRARSMENIAYSIIPFKQVPYDQLLTRKLFLQNHRALLSLPDDRESEIDPVTGAVIVSEEVTFRNAETHLGYLDNTDINVDTVYALREAVVTARSTFTPEYDGQINVDFIIDVPRDIVDAGWRVTLTPSLIDEDSIVHLEPLIVKGGDFVQKQINDYAIFNKYLNSIVDTSDYDNEFLDKESINYDIVNRQELYYNQYYQEWDRQIAYEKWKVDQENFNEKYMAVELGRKDELYHDYERKANEEAMRSIAYGMDTVGIWNRYMSEYRDRTKHLRNNWDAATGIKRIPEEFMDIHENKRTLTDLKNRTLTVSDSLKISKHRYFFDLIAENELKAARIEDRKHEMIQYPFETEIRDTIIAYEPISIRFPYKQTYPTRVGLKKVDIVLNGVIEAVDLSTYTLGTSDTISYFVSSLAQLVNLSLGTSETTLYRNPTSRFVSNVKFAAGKSKFDLYYLDNAEQIDKIIDAYETFTTKGGYVVDSIEVNVRTDLSGSYEGNASAADARLRGVIDHLNANHSYVIEPGVFRFRNNYNGEDWQGFANELQRNSNLQHKDEILAMISNVVNPDETEQEIKQQYPADYRVIAEEIYPKLRYMNMVFHLYTPGMSDDVEVVREEKPDYDRGLELILARDYDAALEIMQNYADYNTALLLACMGYNSKSHELLETLTPNGYTEYLMAILKIRLNDDASAIEHLKRATEMDPSKIFRTKLDPEIMGLIARYNIDLGTGPSVEDIVDEFSVNEESSSEVTTEPAEQAEDLEYLNDDEIE